MSIPIQCPACQHAFAVAERFAGKKGKCPKCGMIFKAPTTADASESSGEIALSAPRPRIVSQPAVPPPKRLPARAAEATAPPSHDSAVETFASVGALPVGKVVVPATQPVFAIGDSGPQRLVHRRKRSSLPMLIGMAVGGLALLGIAIGVVWSLGGGLEAPAIGQNDPALPVENAATDAALISAKSVPPTADGALSTLRPRVLALEIKTAQGTTKAASFLVAERGYAVTSLHAIAQAISVEAITDDEVRIAVGGTVAIDALHDLAMLKLEPTLPIPLDPLALATADPIVNTSVAAIDVANSTNSIVTGKFKTSGGLEKLSPTLRSRIKNLASEWSDEVTFVLHTVNLPIESSGAPLLNSDGKVIGLHLAGDSAGGAALHVRHIGALLESVGEEVRPFAGGSEVATAAEGEATTLAPQDPIDELIARLEEQRAACETLNWTATSAAEYAPFQLLAKFVTQAAEGADTVDVPAEVEKKLSTAVYEVLFGLPRDNWPSDEAWQKTNAQAAAALDAAPGQGVFALARVLVPTSQGNMVGDVPLMVVEIVGQSRMLALPMKSGGDKFRLDAQLLVVGLHEEGPAMEFKGLPLPRVRSKFVLTVQQD